MWVWSSFVCCFLPWALPGSSMFSMMQSTYPYAGTASPGQVSWAQVGFQAPGTVCVSTTGEQDLEQCWDHPSDGRHGWQYGPIMRNHAGYHCPNAKEVDKEQPCYQQGAPAMGWYVSKGVLNFVPPCRGSGNGCMWKPVLACRQGFAGKCLGAH